MSKIERYECPQNLENCKSCSLIQQDTCRRNLDKLLEVNPEIDLSLLPTKAA